MHFLHSCLHFSNHMLIASNLIIVVEIVLTLMFDVWFCSIYQRLGIESHIRLHIFLVCPDETTFLKRSLMMQQKAFQCPLSLVTPYLLFLTQDWGDAIFMLLLEKKNT